MHSESFQHFGRRPEPDRLALLANCQKNTCLFEKSVPQNGFSVADLYHSERNHQVWPTNSSVQNRASLLIEARSSAVSTWAACCNYYYRAAA